MDGFEGITATFLTDEGAHSTVPVTEFRQPRVEPFDRFLDGLEVLDTVVEPLPDGVDAFVVEDLPMRVHNSKFIPDEPSHGAGHVPKSVK